MLEQILKHAKELESDDEFAAYYDGYTFEASLREDKTVDLCPNGAQIALTR